MQPTSPPLKLCDELELAFVHADIQHNSSEYLHLLIEALQLSFADTWWYCADPNKVNVPVEGLLSKSYADTRRSLMNKDK